MRGRGLRENRSVLRLYVRIPPFGDFNIVKFSRKVAEEPRTKQMEFFNSLLGVVFFLDGFLLGRETRSP